MRDIQTIDILFKTYCLNNASILCKKKPKIKLNDFDYGNSST